MEKQLPNFHFKKAISLLTILKTVPTILITFLQMLVKLLRRESPGEVIAHHSTLGVTTQDQCF